MKIWFIILRNFCLSTDDEIKNIFNRLIGTIILIRGNHDRKAVKFYPDFFFFFAYNVNLHIIVYISFLKKYLSLLQKIN